MKAPTVVTVTRRMTTMTRSPRTAICLSGSWRWLSCAAALLAAAGAVVGLLDSGAIYGKETEVLADAAGAQDLVQLLVVSPLIVALGRLASGGSVAGYLVWLGCLAFTAYNYAIYAFSIHFGPLFLLWVAVLGLSSYALAGGLGTLPVDEVKRRFRGDRTAFTAWTLIALAALFAALWLREIVPDLVAAHGSTSAGEWKVPTNPVHVLDLAFFLPAVLASGVLLLRRHPLGYATAAAALVFLALTCLPILLTPVVAISREHVAAWGVLAPIGVVLVVTLAALWRTLSSLTVTVATTPEDGSAA